MSEVPWLKIVQFHKEIAQMKQDDFFCLPLGTQESLDSNRWTLINQMSINDFAGSWKIPYESITSGPLLEFISNNNSKEGYFGGPCWIYSKKEDNLQVKYITPIFYRSVTLELEEEYINVIPNEGNWELSPKINETLYDKEILLEIALEDITHEIIENAHISSLEIQEPLSQCLLNELFKIVPELENIFSETVPKNDTLKLRNYPWIFFLPPTSSSPYTHNIINDYSQLEIKLKRDQSVLGGLKLLENSPSTQKLNGSELLPIVPLNDSQKLAVSEIFKSNPVTVISGPPGCGKSQVVVSLLLNAWANNTSVLFSSTTNAAVDVVFDRISNYECEYPIAIRAGSKTKSTIYESFIKVLNNISANKRSPQFSDNKNRIHRLVSMKNEIQTFLNSKIPHEVTEARISALTSYANYLEVRKDIDAGIDKFSREIKALGYNIHPESFNELILLPLQNWLEKIKLCEYQIDIDSQQRIEIKTKLDLAIKDRNIALQKLCLDPSYFNNLDWLIAGNGPEYFEKWLKTYYSVINQPLEDYLNPIEMKEEFLEWKGEQEALQWICEVNQLVAEIQNQIVSYSKYLTTLNEVRTRFEEKRNEIKIAGLSDNINYDREKLVKWKNDYAYLCSIPNGITSIFKKKKAISQIRKSEEEIRNYYSIEIWRHFSENEENGRKLLNEAIDKSLSWIDILNEWNSNKSIWDEIEKELICLQNKPIIFSLTIKPDIKDPDTLVKLIQKLESKKKIASQAAEAWNIKYKTEEFQQELVKISNDFHSTLLSVPILDSWLHSNELEFTKAVLSFLSSPKKENVVIAQRTSKNARFDTLVLAWNDAREAEYKVRNYTNIINQIPSDKSRIYSWWSEKPQCAVQKLDHTLLPERDDVLWMHFGECKKLNEKWEIYSTTILATKNKEMKDAYDWAIKHLTIAIDKIPEQEDKRRIESILLSFTEQSSNSWRIDKLNEMFNKFDPERIKGKINQIDAQLEILSFDYAKEKWEQNVKADTAVLQSVESLHYFYIKNKFKVKGFSSEKYEKALIAVPVWITTALSSQSIPMEPEIFDLLVIDEASQCTLTNILPLIYRAKRLVLIGDPNQLPAISDISMGKELALASKHGVSNWTDIFCHNNNNMFQLGVHCLPRGRADVISLVEHYRSHPLIIGFSNHFIYQKRLKLRKEMNNDSFVSTKSGVFKINVSGVCSIGNRGKSWINHREINAVCELVKDLKSNEEFDNFKIGIVSPFNAQIEGIKKKLDQLGLNDDILVGTAHVFQGDERDIIIFSPVIAKGVKEGAIKFANSPNLINVALTRAREALFVVADFNYCKSVGGIISDLMNYVDTVMTLRNTSREELELFSWLIVEGFTPEVHFKVGGIEVDFMLVNKSLGIKLIIEVDGKQHYLIEVDSKKYIVQYEGNRRYIKIENDVFYLRSLGNQESVEIQGKSYPVIQTMESIKEDHIRDEYLKGQGFKVLRVPAKAVRETPANVISRIKQELELEQDQEVQ